MKGFIKVLVFTASLILALAASAFAYPVNVGDHVTFANDTYGTTNGGPFIMHDIDNGSTVRTICLERDEYLDYSSTFKIAGISDSADGGGINTNSGDPISDETKWLFWNFTMGNLPVDSDAEANALQVAIWILEDEIKSYEISSDTLRNDALDLITRAQDALNRHETFGDVAVLNMEYLDGRHAQDQLVAAAPVPEPGSILLLGSGIAGLAVFRRRSRR